MGLNLHFTQKNYNIFTYGVDTLSSRTNYDSMSTAQLSKFEWLSTKFPDRQNLLYALIGAHFNDVNAQYDTKEAVLESYFKFKSRRESLTYVIKNDIDKYSTLHNKSFDKLFFKYLSGEFSPEFMLLLVNNSDDLISIYDSINFSWAQPKTLKLMKYESFFNVEKYLPLLENNENHVKC